MLGSWYCNMWFFMNKNDSNSCASLFYNLQDLSCTLKGTWKNDDSAKYRSQCNSDQSRWLKTVSSTFQDKDFDWS